MPKQQRRTFFSRVKRWAWKKLTQQSLTVKLIVTLSLVVGLMVSAGALVLMNIARQAIAETSIATALYQTEFLKGKLIETMLAEDPRHEGLAALLQTDSLSEMGMVHIFDADGRIRFSSDEGNKETLIDLPIEEVRGTVPNNPIVRFDSLKEAGTLTIAHSVHGSKLCLECHKTPEGTFLGGIEIKIPLKPIYKRFETSRWFFAVAALSVIVFGAFLIHVLVNQIVRKPIMKLLQVMEQAEKGELDVRTQIHEDPDLRRLAKSFNAMVQGIQVAQRKIEEQHQKELAQSNRLAILGQSISNVSHEVKNPLAAMKSALHALRGEVPSEDSREIFGEMTLQIDRIEQTVTNLLRYARQAPPRFEKCSLAVPLDQALFFSREQLARNHIQVEKPHEVGEAVVLGDEGQLQQVFLNLFLNAATAMPEGGTLTIEFRRVSAGEEKGFPQPLVRPGWVIAVRDTGSGIRPEDLPRIFDPFYSTKKNGTGLGLSVVRGIVEAHKGLIEVKSELQKGTVVFVFFPVSGY